MGVLSWTFSWTTFVIVFVFTTLFWPSTDADFLYSDFSKTTGLIFNGDAYTSSCIDNIKYMYGGKHQTIRPDPKVEVRISESTDTREVVTTETNPRDNKAMNETLFGHRKEYKESPRDKMCPLRVRLTPSEPHKKSSMWYSQGQEVLRGFECGFTFEISDQSRTCRKVKTANFGVNQYEACRVHGGDGFAFVIHSHPNGTSTLGDGAEGLGYAGIANSLAVEFDTWTNSNYSDVWMDHISVHSNGREANSADERSQFGIQKDHPLADGKSHRIKIRYFPEIKMEYLKVFTASPALLPFIKDNGEGRRIGTLVVWADDMKEALMAMPINLSVLLTLDQGKALLGFTSSTGLSWEKHDITSWYCCEDPPCRYGKTEGMEYYDDGKDEKNEHVDTGESQKVPEDTFGVRPDYDPFADGPFGPVDSDDRYTPLDTKKWPVTDVRDPYNADPPHHYDSVFDADEGF